MCIIDYSVDLSGEKIPRGLQADLDEPEAFYKKEDWISYENLREYAECSIKNCCICGKITRGFGEKIMQKYCGYC